LKVLGGPGGSDFIQLLAKAIDLPLSAHADFYFKQRPIRGHGFLLVAKHVQNRLPVPGVEFRYGLYVIPLVEKEKYISILPNTLPRPLGNGVAEATRLPQG
jgi:hypothetical protein